VPITDSDPRVFFAAERTLLAWVRTALGLIGLGFVVARFGLFLRLLTQQADTAASHHVSPWIGVGLAVLGAIAASSASVQHQRFCRSLAPADMPVGYRSSAGLAVGYGVAIAGLMLAAIIAA